MCTYTAQLHAIGAATLLQPYVLKAKLQPCVLMAAATLCSPTSLQERHGDRGGSTVPGLLSGRLGLRLGALQPHDIGLQEVTGSTT